MKFDMTKLSSFNTEWISGIILVIEAPVFPIRSIWAQGKGENMLAPVGVGFGKETWEEVEGPSMWVERGVSNTGGVQWQLATDYQGWQEVKAVFLWSQFWGKWLGWQDRKVTVQSRLWDGMWSRDQATWHCQSVQAHPFRCHELGPQEVILA